jgi:polyisoprenoid-binding protein YceI
MLSKNLCHLACLAVTAPAALAAQAPVHTLTLQPESHLVANGTSNVRDFACKADTMHLHFTTAEAGAVSAILAGSKVALGATLTVPVAQLDCDNGTMNDHMRDALKSKENPNITFRVDSFTLAKASGAVVATVHGTLTMGGASKPIVLTVHALDGGKGVMHVAGTYQLLMTDYGLKPPTLMLGVFKVHNPVQIEFDLLLKSN